MKINIISECGLNHNGSMKRAVKQIRYSKDAGADAVKFQFYDPEKLLGLDSPYLAYVKTAMFSKEQLEELKRYADSFRIEFMCSVFEQSDIAWADALVKRHKVASRLNQNQEFVEALLATGKPVLASDKTLGYMCTHPLDKFQGRFARLYCVPEYPTALSTFKNIGGFHPMSYSGVSNHCPSMAPALRYASEMVYAMKKTGVDKLESAYFETHTTTSRHLPGCDQSSSWNYDQLETFVSLVRDMEKMSW